MSTGGLALGAAAVLGLAWLLRPSETSEGSRQASGPDAPAQRMTGLPAWPVPTEVITRIGDDTTVRRTAGPHQGLDILVPAGTIVTAPESLVVLRVVNGTGSGDEHRRRAGLWVDGRGREGRILRFLHLRPGSVRLSSGDRVSGGTPIGEVAALDPPHLHFEVRDADWDGRAYGQVINPAELLPVEGPELVRRRLLALRQAAARSRA